MVKEIIYDFNKKFNNCTSFYKWYYENIFINYEKMKKI